MFELKNFGIVVPRETPAGDVAPRTAQLAQAEDRWTVAQSVTLDESDVAEVRVQRQRSSGDSGSAIGAGSRWFKASPKAPESLEVAQGPVDPDCDSMIVLARNLNGEPLSLAPSDELGTEAGATGEEEVLAEALASLEAERG